MAMLLGSLYAGMAFSNSPCAAVHALAYPIGEGIAIIKYQTIITKFVTQIKRKTHTETSFRDPQEYCEK